MLSIIATIGNQKDLIRNFEDHGVGRKALIKYAVSEFLLELKDAQSSANQTQKPITLELLDAEKGTLMHSTVIPAVIVRKPLDDVQQTGNFGGYHEQS